MTEEQNKCTALIVRPRDGEALEVCAQPVQAIARPERRESWIARKRREFREALERDEVGDPISALVSIGISLAVSYATSALAAAFAPKPKPIERGMMQGQFSIRSSAGELITEVYGAGPDPVSAPSYLTPSYANLANVTAASGGAISKTGGANNSYNAGASVSGYTAALDTDAAIKFTAGTGTFQVGFCTTASPTHESDFLCSIQCHSDGRFQAKTNGAVFFTDLGNWRAGDQFQIEIRGNRFRIYQNNVEKTRWIAPVPSFPLYLGVIAYSTGAGPAALTFRTDGTIGDTPNHSLGGAKVSAQIIWSTGPHKVVTVSQQQVGGGKGFGGHQTQQVNEISYDINVALMWGRGPLDIRRIYAYTDIVFEESGAHFSGVVDPDVPADTDYDKGTLPDPNPINFRPWDRFDGTLDDDGQGGKSGQIAGGSYASIVNYEGSATQLPDPTIENDINTKFGPNSTPGYRNRSMTVLGAFNMGKYGNVLPTTLAALVAHKVIKNFRLFCEHFSQRVGTLTSDDYDFSAVSGVLLRGFQISGSQKFQPRTPMEALAQAFNCYFYEADKIYCLPVPTESAGSIPFSDMCWQEEDRAPDTGPLPEPETIYQAEIKLPRSYTVKYVSPDNDFEPQTQVSSRQVTTGEHESVLELALTLLDDEARQIADRELYLSYLKDRTHRFTLSWEYLYLHPGDVRDFTTPEGITYKCQILSISGGLGILEVEAVEIEPETFTQPSVGANGSGLEPLPAPIPVSLVLALLDLPLLDEKHASINGGAIIYVAATPLTSTAQRFKGWTLYLNRLGWEQIGNFPLPATMGRIVSCTGLTSSALDEFEEAATFIIDLYGTTDTLESASKADVLNGANRGVFGDMVCQWLTAARVNDGSPNRWQVSGILAGRNTTESHIGDDFAGKRFVLLNAAVQPVPYRLDMIGNTYQFKAIAVGQSFDDGAIYTDTLEGNSVKPASPVQSRAYRDDAGNILEMWRRRAPYAGQLASEIDVPLAEESEQYRVSVPDAPHPRTMPVFPGMSVPAFMEYQTEESVDGVIVWSLGQITTGTMGSSSVTPSHTAPLALLRSVQLVERENATLEATLMANGAGAGEDLGEMGFGLIQTGAETSAYADFECRLSAGYDGSSYHHQYCVYENNILKYSGPVLSGTGPARIRIMLVGSEVQFYADVINGDGSFTKTSKPFYSSQTPPTYSLKAYVAAAYMGTCSQVRMSGHVQPQTVYSAAQIRQDFNLGGGDPLPSTIHLRIQQVGRFGLGQPLDVTV